jgi:hypothetical protein
VWHNLQINSHKRVDNIQDYQQGKKAELRQFPVTHAKSKISLNKVQINKTLAHAIEQTNGECYVLLSNF